ncbi:MAG: ABC transporter permease [Verrucomicrobiota bacterium]
MAESPAITTMPAAEPAEEGVSLWQDAWHRLARNRMAIGSAIVLAIMMILSFGAPLIAKQKYDEQNLQLGAVPPNAKYWLGTDYLGRDQFTRLLYGGRVSITVGLVATAVSLVIGVLYGAIAGYLGGKADTVMMRIVDALYSLPLALMVILLMVFAKDMGTNWEQFLLQKFEWKTRLGEYWNLILIFAAIGAVEWLTMARIVRAQVQALRKQEFIEAAFALGLRKRRIILRHLLPNVLGPVVVYSTLTVPAVMLLEAFLSFLGLGVQPPMSSWGLMINDGAQAMEEHPWLLIAPGTALAMTLFCLNFLGDGLRDALDVRASKD